MSCAHDEIGREDLMRLEALKLALVDVPGWAPDSVVERAEVFLAFLSAGPAPEPAPLAGHVSRSALA